MKHVFTVATYLSLAEADPPRLALEAAGIPTFSTDEGGDIKLQVPEKYTDAAREVLAEFETEAEMAATCESGDHVHMTCPHCDAEVSFPFERRGYAEECPECGGYVDVSE